MPALGMRTGVYSPCDSYVILKENYQPLLLNIFDLKLVVVNLALVQTIRVGGGGAYWNVRIPNHVYVSEDNFTNQVF